MKTMFWKKYKHSLVLLYGLIYFPWFIYLEKTVTTNFNVIHTTIDDYIPFIEYFIVPYMLWFLYIAATIAYFFFTDVKGYYKLTFFLFTGMTVFLIVSTLYPNGQLLRPVAFERDNIFVEMVKKLYLADTPTNILPSIHVYNSIGTHIAITHNVRLKEHRWITVGSAVLMTLIILSTVFLKQHSVIDVILATAMAFVFYSIVYKPGMAEEGKRLRHQLT